MTDPPPGQGLARYARQPVRWAPCRNDLQCASVLAPLDYAAPDGPAVTLRLARRAATGHPRLGVLFLNPGGPGGSGIGLVDAFDPDGLKGYDLVGWDPRGVGESTPVRCFDGRRMDQYTAADISPDSAREEDQLLEEQREFGRSCLARSGPLLAHVSTLETVRDLDLLRGLLGQSRISYLGFSYGTEIGALYAQRYGSRVRRMVLDGAVDLTDSSPVTQAEGFERALRAFARWCADERCPLGSSSDAVLQTVVRLWQRLDEDPLRVGSRQLTQTLAVDAVIFLLYSDAEFWPVLSRALRAAVHDDDGRPLLALADAFLQRSKDGAYGQLNSAFPAVRCLDSPDTSVTRAKERAAQAITDAPTVGPFFGADLTCPLWPVAPAPPWGKVTAPEAPPILVVGSTGDPATPYEWAVQLARQLKSGVLVTREGAGHTAYDASECVQDVVRAYLVAGKVPRDGKRCER